LLAYPFLIEPSLGLVAQARIFRWLYIALIVFAGVLLTRVRPLHPRRRHQHERIPWQRRLRWIGWAAVPSFALLAVTRHIATDVASFPLLWVVPLALYLATFILAFSARSEVLRRIAARAFPLRAVIALTAASGVLPNLFLGIGIPLGVLIASGLIAHCRLYADRPTVSSLTEFYLWISVGGAVGGMLGAFVAPLAFNSIAEYPLALVATSLLLTGQLEPRKKVRLVLVPVFVVLLIASVGLGDVNAIALAIGAAGAVAYLLAGRSAWFALLLGVALLVAQGQSDARVLARERTFYGVYRVLATEEGDHMMVSGTTIHGVQRFKPAPTLEPLAYYVEDGPFGQLMTGPGAGASRIGVIGLGAGALASYLEAGQDLTFFEIDPVVVDLAENPNLFTLTSSTEGEVHFVTGDGRLTMQQSKEPFDLVIIDAFTSDAIPTHLMTREAIQSYLQVLADNGVIGFHISNRHFDLEPILGRIARELGLVALGRHYQPTSPEGSAVSFVVLAREAGSLSHFVDLPGWETPKVSDELWTDEFTNLLGVLR
jgi:spermidine synthase